MTKIPPALSVGEETLALHIRLYNLPEPVREFKFHPDRDWRLDFYWQDFGLAVEVQGGTYTGKGHAGGAGYQNDCEKLNAAQLAGLVVLQYTTEMVVKATAIDELRRYFDRRKLCMSQK